MKRTRFTEERIIGVLEKAEAGAKTADLARRYSVSEATIYDWKSKGGERAVSSMPIARACVTVPRGTITPVCVRSCASWPTSAAGSAIAVCISCCAKRG